MAHPLDIHDIYLGGVPFARQLEHYGCQIATAQKILDEHADKPVPERVAEVLRHYRLKALDGAAIEVVRRSGALSADATTRRLGACSRKPLFQVSPDARSAGTRDYYGGATNPYEAIKVIEAWGLNFRLGSVLKYIKRDLKSLSPLDRLIDLEKAAWYLQREIQVLRDRLPPSEQTPDARAGLARQAAAPAKPSSAAAPSDWPTHDAALGSAYNAGDGTR